MNRRDFLKSGLGLASAAGLATALPLAGWAVQATPGAAGSPLLLAVTGPSPADNTRRAIQALGGIEKFVKPGQAVFLKPNCITTMGEQFAVNTNPAVVGEVARLCRLAGASKVYTLCHDDPNAWEPNGIGPALTAEGATYGAAQNINQYRRVELPLGLLLRETMVISDLLDADVFINLPVAKHHAGSGLTIGFKNYMGLNWDRQIMHHTDLHQCIADLATVRRADLTVVDATRIMLTNGPSGPGSVRETQMVIASEDPVAADAYAATLFKMEPQRVRHLRYAHAMGLGEINPDRMEVRLLT